MTPTLHFARGTTVTTTDHRRQVLVDIDGGNAVLADEARGHVRRPMFDVLREHPMLLDHKPAAALGIDHPVDGMRVRAPVGGTHVYTPATHGVPEQWFELDADRWASIGDSIPMIGAASRDRERMALARIGDERIVVLDGQLADGARIVHGPEAVGAPGRLQTATDTALDAVRMLDSWFTGTPEHTRRTLIEVVLDTPRPRAPGNNGVTKYLVDGARIEIDAARPGEHAPWRSPHTVRHEVLHARLYDLLGRDMHVANGNAGARKVEGTAVHEGLADAFASIGERNWYFGEIPNEGLMPARPPHRRPDLGTYAVGTRYGGGYYYAPMPATLDDARAAAGAVAAGRSNMGEHAVGGYISGRFARIQRELGWTAAEDALRGTIGQLMLRARAGDLVVDLGAFDEAFETALRGAARLARR